MKKVVLTISLLGSISFLSAINIDNLRWTEDYKALVALNSGFDKSIEGADQNKNGIRDDVEYYINNKYKNDPFQRGIFKEAAKKIQKILTLDISQKEEHIKLDQELLNLYTCRDYMLYKLQVKNIKEEMKNKMIFKAKVLNTNQRLQTYIAHKKSLPFVYKDLTNDELQRDKRACLKLYSQLTDQKSLVSEAKNSNRLKLR